MEEENKNQDKEIQDGEEEEEEKDPLENPHWKLYAFKSPIHSTHRIKDEFMQKT